MGAGPSIPRGKMQEMKPTVSAADKRLSRVLRLGVLVLVVGVLAFAGIYWQDQHVVAGPSMTGRQIEGAEAAVKKAPNNIGTRLQLAEAYRIEKRHDDELKQYAEILKADKGNRTALLGRGGALMAKGDLKASAAEYRKITGNARKGEFAGADPQLQEAYYYLGSIALKEGKTKDAISSLQSALKIVRSDSDALYLMGVARLKNNEPQLAVDSLKQALLFVPTGWCEPQSQIALAYTKLGNAPQATYSGAMADFCLKKHAEATRRLKTLTTGPAKLDAMLGLGLIAETGNNNPEAISWYQKALTLDRTNINAISSLSRLGVAPPAAPKPKAKAMASSTTQGAS
jgi:tetratricopeptide (TPR) repeat protein